MDIEDILNGSDDDDDVDISSSSVHPNTNFDVDALLDESDSDEESIKYSFRGDSNSKHPTGSINAYHDTRNQRNDMLEALLELPVGDMDISSQDPDNPSSSSPVSTISSPITRGNYKGMFDDSAELSWKLSTQQRSGEFHDDIDDQLFSIDKMPISLESAYRHELLSQSSGHRKFSSLLGDSSASMTGLKAGSLTEISSQLSKNAQFKNHGPGKATALYVSESYFVIGTSRGIALLFDNQQELRNVISVHANPTTSSSSAASTSVAGITSIDFHQETNLLICGFDNGNISLIDTKKSAVLKGILDVHMSSIIKVRICRSEKISLDMIAVSVDKNGMVYRFNFKKTLWGLSADKTCLLDGSAGIIYDLSVLKHSADSKDVGGKGTFNELIAFNSSTRTYIVQMAPKIEVVYRWILSPGEKSTDDTTADKTDNLSPIENCAISLKWNTYNSPQADGSSQYLLRSYLSKVEILCCRAAKRAGDYSFYVAASHIFTDKCIASSLCMVDKIAILFPNEIYITDFQFNIICQHQLQHPFHHPIEMIGSNTIYSVPDVVVSRDSCIYLLSKENLRSYDMMSASSQLEKLIQSDNWLPALSIAMKLHKDPGKSANLNIKDYIQRYCNTFLKSNSLAMQSVQPIFIAEVCIEFCINCELEEFMFQDVYELFVSFDMQAPFLQAIESAILNKVVKSTPLKVLKDLLAASIKNSRTYVFENCIIKLNLQNVVTSAFTEVLLNHGMFSAYLYCCSYDNVSPQNALAALFNFVYTAAEDIKPVVLDKIMLYILFIAERRRFPSGENINISTNDIHGVLAMAVSSSSLPDSSIVDSDTIKNNDVNKNQSILSTLWDHDSASLLFCLRKGVDVLLSQGKTAHVRILYSLFAHVSGLDLDMTSSGIGSNRKSFLDAFIEIVVECPLEMPYSSMHATSSALKSTSSISFEMIYCVLIYLSSYHPRNKADFLARRLAISQSQLESEKDRQVSEAFRNKKFWRALLLVDKELSEDIFREALLHYVSYKNDEEYRNQVFDFLEEVTTTEDTSSQNNMEISLYVYDIISKFLEELALLNTEKTLALAQLFSHAPLNIFKKLFKLFPQDSRTRFLFLESCFKSVEAEVEMKEIVSDPTIMLGYFELLAEFEPNSCLSFLTRCGYTSSCRDTVYEIALNNRIYDVQVHILERENNIDAALETLMKEMKDSLLALGKASSAIQSDEKAINDGYNDKGDTTIVLATTRSCDNVLSSVCRLCSSNGGNTGGDVWFAALNNFLQIKEEVEKSQEVKEVIENSLRVLITLMSNQVQSSDIVRHITARDFSLQESGKAYDLSSLFHTMKESLEQDHYIAKIILNIYTHDMHDVFSRKIDKTKSAIFIDPSNKTQEELLKSLSNEFNEISSENERKQRFLKRKSLKSMNSSEQNGMDLSPKAQLDMNFLSAPISQKREPKSLPMGAKFNASL